MLQRLLFAVVFLAAVSLATENNLEHRIANLLEASPSIKRGHAGFVFVDMTSGQVLAQQSASGFFTPASNTKLYTTAFALARLGAGYKFQTLLETSTAWLPGLHAISDLALIGGGDPNLSGRVVPYAPDSNEGDPLLPLRALAAKLSAAGLKQIKGDITGVSTRYPNALYPDGWTIDDSLYSYGAPVTALALNDNTISLLVRPTEIGALAEIELRPALTHFVILNQVTTTDSKETTIEITRPPGSNEVVLRGSISSAAPEWREDLAVEDPALFAAEALLQVLNETGIEVSGDPRSQYCETVPCSPPSGTVLAARDSVPLSEEIRIANKVSQNLHSEMLLRECAFSAHGNGSLAAGLADLEAFLQQAGIAPNGGGIALGDGSGLARQDLATPDSTVALLRYMWARPERDIWLESLAIGGSDGSLEHRFKNFGGAFRIHAKTGSFAHVNALSGYLEPRPGHWLAFSIMVNATVAPESDVRDFIDRLCEIVLSESER